MERARNESNPINKLAKLFQRNQCEIVSQTHSPETKLNDACNPKALNGNPLWDWGVCCSLSGLENRKRKTPRFWMQRTWTQALAQREASKSQEIIAVCFLNAGVLPRKSLNRNLSWGFPLGNLLTKTRVLEHCVLERKREPNTNTSVLGTLRFRTLRLFLKNMQDSHIVCDS